MTKEKMIEQVEIASKIYDLLKDVPVNQRHLIMGMLEQFQRADWDKAHQLEKAAYANTSTECAPKNAIC